MIEVASVARESIAVTSSVDATSTELLSLFFSQVPMVALVQDTICERAARTNREYVTLQSSTVRIDVEQCRTLKNNQIGKSF